MTVVRDQLFPQKPPGSRFRFSRTGAQPSPGSSTIELPSAFAESGAYPLDRELPGSPRRCSLPLACRHSPEGHQIGAQKRRTHENTILSQPSCRRVSADRPNREGSQLAASLEGEPGPTPAGKTLPHSYPETRFRRERARINSQMVWPTSKKRYVLGSLASFSGSDIVIYLSPGTSPRHVLQYTISQSLPQLMFSLFFLLCLYRRSNPRLVIFVRCQPNHWTTQLLLPSCLIVVSLLGYVWNSGTAPVDV